ncbi:hypothetical protein JCGZ_25203 [Jatropha curcas]|uniref:Bulb-type lectin domain-containing protein n=1 Tax=Jatropha curcas TaxID=180498 RepID=A0A067L3L3_JATCU|nr:hypothetical protein JCGZ_25203 [Jatropha curcas]
MLLFLLFLSSIFSRVTAQQRTCNISLGSSLTPTNTSYWSSVSGHFAFGFSPKEDGFAIGIWFAKIRQKTVIWTANGDDPPLPGAVTLTLSSDGKLIIQLNQGQIPFQDFPRAASSASILDSEPCMYLSSCFYVVDESQKNLGCKRNSEVYESMSLNESSFTMQKLQFIPWEDNPYSILSSTTRTDCEMECSRDCNCVAAVYKDRNCRKQKLPLRFGRIQDDPKETFIKIAVAVKKLEKVVAEGEVEFQNELRSISRTHNRNLVRLLGYYHD